MKKETHIYDPITMQIEKQFEKLRNHTTRDLIMTMVLFSLFGFIFGSTIVKCPKPDIRYLSKEIVAHRSLFDAIRNVTVTVYQSTKEQCGNTNGIGYSGRKMQWGDIAISQQLQFDHLNNGDKVWIDVPVITPQLFTVSDVTSNKLSGYVVDIWIPLDSKIAICKKGCTILKLKQS